MSFERLPSSPPLIAGFHLSPPRCNILKSQGVRSAESVNDGFLLARTSHSVHARTARIGPEGFRRAACLLRNRFSLPKTRLSCKSLPAPVSEPHRSTVTCNRPKGISLVSGQYLMRCSPFWVVSPACFVEAFFCTSAYATSGRPPQMITCHCQDQSSCAEIECGQKSVFAPLEVVRR